MAYMYTAMRACRDSRACILLSPAIAKFDAALSCQCSARVHPGEGLPLEWCKEEKNGDLQCDHQSSWVSHLNEEPHWPEISNNELYQS